MRALHGIDFLSFILLLLFLFAAHCASGCSNGGTCTGPDICDCLPGWTGSFCETGTAHALIHAEMEAVMHYKLQEIAAKLYSFHNYYCIFKVVHIGQLLLYYRVYTALQ